MMRIGLILSLLVSTQVPASSLVQAPADFIDVTGADLEARLSAARARGRQNGPFWAAYAFPVRSGVAFDAAYIGTGRVIVFGGASAAAPIEAGRAEIFLLHERARGPVRVEIYDTRRPRDHAGLPVYWLGHAAADESVAVLRGLVTDAPSQDVAGRLVDAIGAHDLPDVPTVLRDIVSNSTAERPRTAAISWLGYWPGQTEFLAALVRNERELTPVRQEAAESLADAPDRDVLPVLQGLYRTVTHREIKGELLEGIADERFEASASTFLIEIAGAEPDRQLRREALKSLGERSDTATLQALEQIAGDPEVPPDLQHEAVEAISDRAEHEAIPLLKTIVTSHPRAGARRAALEELAGLPGQSGFLTGLAGDANQTVDLRLAAIEAIADADTVDAVATLQKLYATAGSSAVKEGLIEAIADTRNPPAAILALTSIVRNEADRGLRAEAVSALGDIEDERAVDALGQLYDSTRDEGTRRDILEALSEAEGPVALQTITAAARSDPSMTVRRHAIELLGESDDPAAVGVLESLLK
jgi:HEAT repeat protein